MMRKNNRKKKEATKSFKISEHKFFRYIFIYFALVVVALASYVTTHLLFFPRQHISLCANSKSCKSDLKQQIDNDVTGIFEGKVVYPPSVTTRNTQPDLVLGSSIPAGEKYIYVDLSTQTLVAYQGTTQVLKTLVATGKWNPTPVGNFHIWEKLLATRMSGGEGADAYDLPNVPYVMYFYNDFGLHGAYWHDNFGHEMSHGCVNMRQIDAKKLYDWADGPSGGQLGTAVSICDSITKNNQCVQNNPIQ